MSKNNEYIKIHKMKYVCEKADQCYNVDCYHYNPHEHNGDECFGEWCTSKESFLECVPVVITKRDS